MPPLDVLAVVSEIFPLIKTGGLADVAGALPGALAAEGVKVRTLVPGYPSVLHALEGGVVVATQHLFGDEARIFRPQLLARFVLNRCAARSVIARETAEALAEHEPPVLAARIGQRVSFADVARSGRLVAECDPAGPAACEISALALEVAGLVP